MNITKNWFYKLSEIKSSKIIIENNLVISIFDDLNKSLEVELWKDSRLDFYWFAEKVEDLNINFIQKQEWSQLKVHYLLLSKNNNKLKTKISSEIKVNNIKANLYILSIIWNNWFVDLDGIIKIDNNIEKINWNLLEENLFLGNKWRVKAVPTLLVKSNDVKASHSCKMERISDEKLFYLRSRWIWRQNALVMMIEAKIKSLFSCLFMFDNTFYKELVEKILKKVQ